MNLYMSHRSPQSISRSAQAVWVCVAFALVVDLASSSPADYTSSVRQHHIAKRSFWDLDCKGVYDKSIFAKLDRICEDCYNLFREPSIHSLCRKKCFSTKIFKGCVQSLMLEEQMERLLAMVDYLGK